MSEKAIAGPWFRTITNRWLRLKHGDPSLELGKADEAEHGKWLPRVWERDEPGAAGPVRIYRDLPLENTWGQARDAVDRVLVERGVELIRDSILRESYDPDRAARDEAAGLTRRQSLIRLMAAVVPTVPRPGIGLSTDGLTTERQTEAEWAADVVRRALALETELDASLAAQNIVGPVKLEPVTDPVSAVRAEGLKGT